MNRTLQSRTLLMKILFALTIFLTTVSQMPSVYAQTTQPSYEELVSWVELLRSRQEVLTSEVNDFKADVREATAEMAAEDAAVRDELTTEISDLRAEMHAAVSMAAPPGTIAAFYGTAAPAGWLVCDGTSIPQGEQYNALRALVGPNTPDLRGRVILMADPNGSVLPSAVPAFGHTGGEEKHVLTTDEMPRHSHYLFSVSTAGCPADGFRTSCSYGYWTSWNQFTQYEKSSYEAGGDQPHNNLPPYFALNWIIKY